MSINIKVVYKFSSFDAQAHANPIFVRCRVLKFEDIIKLQRGKVMYLYTLIAFFLIVLMTCFCSTVTYIHKTRSKNSFRLPYCGTNVRKFSLRFQGPKIFNSLSFEIQNASIIASFNSKLESFFLV